MQIFFGMKNISRDVSGKTEKLGRRHSHTEVTRRIGYQRTIKMKSISGTRLVTL
jgi:hypothetical protein